MDENQTPNEGAALPAVPSTAWLDALGWHIAAMKAREEKHRCDINDSQIKLDVTRVSPLDQRDAGPTLPAPAISERKVYLLRS